MFIKIKYADDKELLANPDCRIGSLLDYVKATMAESELFDTDLHNEIDLCDDYGRLLNVNDVEPWKNGLELRLFQPRATYFVFLISLAEAQHGAGVFGLTRCGRPTWMRHRDVPRAVAEARLKPVRGRQVMKMARLQA
ncbi:uncharacterized protein LOC126236472 isoform X2 [Schistocerca nitens]|uniref:uncharacterized protein LOC126236472 isoform X2 n=1 Tax=Schistocerca nitens TaxID=7011 RepID=UPI002119336E|nr:uncharacterized protein LOC126236472 isoform X2 [Schistocerca nitens]